MGRLALSYLSKPTKFKSLKGMFDGEGEDNASAEDQFLRLGVPTPACLCRPVSTVDC